jgi:hypothetical protein
LLFCYYWHCDNIVEWEIEGSHPGRSNKFASSPERPDRFWGPPSLLLNGYRRFFFGANRPGHENLSPASSAEVKNEWSLTSTRHMAWTGAALRLLLITALCLILHKIRRWGS